MIYVPFENQICDQYVFKNLQFWDFIKFPKEMWIIPVYKRRWIRNYTDIVQFKNGHKWEVVSVAFTQMSCILAQ